MGGKAEKIPFFLKKHKKAVNYFGTKIALVKVIDQKIMKK